MGFKETMKDMGDVFTGEHQAKKAEERALEAGASPEEAAQARADKKKQAQQVAAGGASAAAAGGAVVS